jgi:hypothetical protein
MSSRAVLSLCAAAVILISYLSACSSSSSSSSAPQPPANSSPTSGPSSNNSVAVTAATDCSQSNISLPIPSTIPSGSISAETDSTRTSLLIENTGDQTLLVVPQQNTVLQQTPDVNPTDPVDVAALKALGQTTFLESDQNLPAGTQLDTVFIVPPKYGVCGTVAEVGEYPDVSVERDKEAGAVWFVLRAIAQSLYNRVAFAGDEDIQAMATCANDTASLSSTQPDLSDIDLYATVMQAGASCYKSYEAVFEDTEESDRAEEDASRVREDALDLLDKAPELLESIRFVIDSVHK